MHGNYEIVWKYEKYEEFDKEDDEDEVKGREVIIGWRKIGGYDLNELHVRNIVSSAVVNGAIGHEIENIPFFIRMFGCKFIKI